VRVLVTGGAGFLGSHLVDRLLAEHHEVDVIDDLSSGSLANLAAARAEAAGALHVHHLDLRTPHLTDLLARRRPEVIFHLGQPGPGAAPRERAEIVVVGTVNLLEAALASGTAKIVTALDAVALYGEVPSKELPIREGQAFAPVTLAGVLDRAAAELLAQYRAVHDLEFTALALASVYGPRQGAARGLVTAILAASGAGAKVTLPGDLRQTRDLLFVDDAVDALVRAGTRGSGLVVNVGSGVQTSLRELHQLCAGEGALPAEVGPAESGVPPRFAISPVRARIHLGWAPWTSLPEGIAIVRRSLLPA
jgi:UDP-glucose 4-epimerase